MTLVAGCYERFLFGYTFSSATESKAAGLHRSFTYPAHQGPVKCVAVGAQLVASGGADDQIHLYDLQAGTDLGFLMSPGDGAVTAVKFYTPRATAAPTHLFSGSADGGLSIWKAGGGWECLKTLKGHRREITGLTIHPTGRLALTTSRDETLRMWDLVKGRCPYDTKVPAGSELVEFSTSGSSYAVGCDNRVTLHTVADEGGLTATLEHPRKTMCLAFHSDLMLLTGSEDGSCRLWDTRSSQTAVTIPQAHNTRIRGLALLQSSASASASATGDNADIADSLVATGASDGVIRVWDMRMASSSSSSQAEPLCEASTSARLTCLASVAPLELLAKQRAEAKAEQKRSAAQQIHQEEAGHHNSAKQNVEPVKALAGKRWKASGKQAVAKKPKLEAAKPVKVPVEDGVVHDGVVDFAADETRKQKKQKQKQKQRKQQAKQQTGLEAGAAAPGHKQGQRATVPAQTAVSGFRIVPKQRRPRPV